MSDSCISACIASPGLLCSLGSLLHTCLICLISDLFLLGQFLDLGNKWWLSIKKGLLQVEISRETMLSLEELATGPCPVVCQTPWITCRPQSVPALCVLSGCLGTCVDLHSAVFCTGTTSLWATAGSPWFFPTFSFCYEKGTWLLWSWSIGPLLCFVSHPRTYLCHDVRNQRLA